MKIKELRQKPKEELQKILVERKTRLSELKFSLAEKKNKNVKELGILRKDIARLLTLLNAGAR